MIIPSNHTLPSLINIHIYTWDHKENKKTVTTLILKSLPQNPTISGIKVSPF